MTEPDPTPRRAGLLRALAVTAVAGASVVTIALPHTALAEPVPPTTTAAPAPPPPPADPNAPAAPGVPPAPADPNAPLPPPAAPVDPLAPPPPAAPVDPLAPPPPAAPVDPLAPPPPAAPVDPLAPPPVAPADPNAPAPAPEVELGRVTNAAGGFSYLVPAGWEVADASRLSYGQALLLKQTGPAPLPGVAAPTASDTSILIGRLDLKLFAGAEPDNSKAAVRLASDMGEFFMPFPGTRINQATSPIQAGDMPGSAASYDVKFTDTAKPNGQIWAGVVGSAGTQRNQPGDRWFVVWLGTGKDPIDTEAAKVLASSIRPYTPPPPPAAPAPDPNAPAVPPPPGDRVGVPVPVTTPVPEMTPAG